MPRLFDINFPLSTKFAARLVVLLTFLSTIPAPTLARDDLSAYDTRTAAPAFELADPSGKRYALKDYKGKVLVVNFWATWCPPCRKEMPSMQRLWRALQAQGVELIAIDFGESAEDVAAFAAETGIEIPLLLDPTGDIVHKFKAVGLPTTFIIDRQGRLAYHAAGEREWDAPKIAAVLAKLAAEPLN